MAGHAIGPVAEPATTAFMNGYFETDITLSLIFLLEIDWGSLM